MANLQLSGSIGGVGFSGAIADTGGGQEGSTWTIAKGYAGSLTTRTDNDTGVVTTTSTPTGISNSDLVDVYWAGGKRYGMTATVSGSEVTLDGGAGDNLPAQDTACVICEPTAGVLEVTGDNVEQIVVASSRRAIVCFMTSAPAVIAAVEVAAGGAYVWSSSLGTTNPLAGEVVASLLISTGDSSYDSTVKVGIDYDNT